MIQLNLTTEERDTLVEALESYLSELRMEIADTDSHDYRASLKSREGVLKKVLEALEGTNVNPW